MLGYYVTLDHKTSHKGQFIEIEIYISSESRKFFYFQLMYSFLWQHLATVWKSGIWRCLKIKMLNKIALKLSKWSS